MRYSIALSAIAAAIVPAIVVAAPSPVLLTSTVQVEKTVVVGGREQTVLKTPETVLPGDRLIFQTSFRNSGTAPATRFVVTNPIPSGVAFTGESTVGAEVSVDGGHVYGALATLKVKTATGALRPAQAADVTDLRWTLATIAPGAGGNLRYRGLVR